MTLQIAGAIQVLHMANHLHKNIKLCNILVFGEKNNEKVFKLADSIELSNNQIIDALMLPTVIQADKYNASCDVWQLGICLFQLLYK